MESNTLSVQPCHYFGCAYCSAIIYSVRQRMLRCCPREHCAEEDITVLRGEKRATRFQIGELESKVANDEDAETEDR